MRYYGGHERPSAWGNYFSNNVVNKIVLINVVVFLVQNVFGPGFNTLFAYQPRMLIEHLWIWQPLTYMFLHGSFGHLFFNMLMLWFLGTTIENVWGGRRFIKYYITCGLGGALAFTIFNFNGGVLGASGAILGVLLAYGMMFPDNYLLIYFFLPVKAKYFVTFIALLNLAYGVSGMGGIAYFAHLGGMAAGLLFFPREIKSSTLWRRMARHQAHHTEARREKWRDQEGTKIDSILDKIASKGYENLSATEKRILENYSRKQQDTDE